MKNRYFKLILITVISILLVISSVCAVLAEESRGTLKITCDMKSITAGNEITLNFNYSEPIAGGLYRLVYDKALLTLVSVDAASTVRSMTVEDTADKDVVFYYIKNKSENSTVMPTVTFKVNAGVKEGDELSVGVASTIQLTDPDNKTIAPEAISAWSYRVPSSDASCSSVSVTLYKTAQDRDIGIGGITKNLSLSGGNYVINDLVYTNLYYRLSVTPKNSNASVSYDSQNGVLKTGSANSNGFTIVSESGRSVHYNVVMNTLACGHDWEIKSVDNVASSCTEGGHTITTYKCSICSNERTEKTNITEPLGHDYIGERFEPDCENNGYLLHTCSRCDSSYQDEEVSALGHDYVAKSSTSTCSSLGETTYECRRCNDSYSQKDTVMPDHKYTSVHTASTCTVLGKTVYTCSECGNTYTENEKELAKHSEKTIVTPPQCLQSGWIKTVCSVCDKVLGSAPGDNATGHLYGEWTIVVAATAESEGMMKRSCSECDAFETDRIPKLVDGNISGNSGMLILVIVLIVGIIILGILLIVTYLTYRKKREKISKS